MKRLLFCLLSMCALCLTASAHVLDQYLQVTQIALAPNNVRIELRLIPGVRVAGRICTLIDMDGNGQITKVEEQAYAQRVSHDIALAVGGVNVPLTLTNNQFPSQQEMREGLGTIRLTYETSTSLSTATQPQLYFRNNHLPEIGVYLVNALMPTTNEIKLGRQERDPLQRELRLGYQITPTSTPVSWRGAAILIFCLCLMLWKSLRHFLRKADGNPIYAKQ